jgi:hypothetical protein
MNIRQLGCAAELAPWPAGAAIPGVGFAAVMGDLIPGA